MFILPLLLFVEFETFSVGFEVTKEGRKNGRKAMRLEDAFLTTSVSVFGDSGAHIFFFFFFCGSVSLLRIP